LKERKKMTCSA